MQIARYIEAVPNWQYHRADAHDELVQSLTRLVTVHPPGSLHPRGGLFFGPLSIAYLLLRLHEWYPDLRFGVGNRTLRAWASEYRQKAVVHRRGPLANQCGVIDEAMTSLALEAAFDRNVNAVTQFVKWANAVADSEEAGNEWLYGRAGTLYFVRLIRRHWAETPSLTQPLDLVASKLIKSIMEAERPWTWYDTNYVGAAHGTIGIITQIVLTRPSTASELQGELRAILDAQISDSGNFPAALPAGRRERLVQFCHGAPGVVNSLMSLRDYFPNLREHIDVAIQKGQECTLKLGVLTKEPCLCHGSSGNAVALEGEAFECLINHTTAPMMARMEQEGVWEPSDNPEGLYTGEAGRAWAWAVADQQLEKRYLGYNDL